MPAAATPETRRLGEMLRRHRRALGLSQMEVAHRGQLSQRKVSRAERGEPGTTMDTLARFARVLRVAGAPINIAPAKAAPPAPAPEPEPEPAQDRDVLAEAAAAGADLVIMPNPRGAQHGVAAVPLTPRALAHVGHHVAQDAHGRRLEPVYQGGAWPSLTAEALAGTFRGRGLKVHVGDVAESATALDWSRGPQPTRRPAGWASAWVG